jgi:hypothetical protein
MQACTDQRGAVPRVLVLLRARASVRRSRASGGLAGAAP